MHTVFTQREAFYDSMTLTSFFHVLSKTFEFHGLLSPEFKKSEETRGVLL